MQLLSWWKCMIAWSRMRMWLPGWCDFITFLEVLPPGDDVIFLSFMISLIIYNDYWLWYSTLDIFVLSTSICLKNTVVHYEQHESKYCRVFLNSCVCTIAPLKTFLKNNPVIIIIKCYHQLRSTTDITWLNICVRYRQSDNMPTYIISLFLRTQIFQKTNKKVILEASE